MPRRRAASEKALGFDDLGENDQRIEVRHPRSSDGKVIPGFAA
jgi:hypothetical protein